MKRLLAVLLILSMLLWVAGCDKKEKSDSNKKLDDVMENIFGNSEDSDENSEEVDEDAEEADEDSEYDEDSEDADNKDEEEADAEDSGSSILEYLEYYESASDLLDTFREFGYVYTTQNPGEDPVTWSFEYVSMGKETIDGVETDHIKITMVENGETDITEGWYNDEWVTVKYIDANGEEQTGINAEFAGSTLTMMAQLYNNLSAIHLAMYPEGILDESYYEIVDTGSDNMDLGFGSTKVELQDIKSTFGGFLKHVGTAKINDKNFYVILETETEEGALDGMRITKAILR